MTMYASYFFGFLPETEPIITFSSAGYRDSLLRRANPGDEIVYIATNGPETDPPERGLILGAAEIGNKSARTIDLIDPAILRAEHFVDGLYRWPEAIPMLRAWRFVPPPEASEILSKPLGPAGQKGAVRLSPEDEAAIRSLQWEEVALVPTHEVQRQAAVSAARTMLRSRPGPVPSAGKHEVVRTPKTTAWTYAFRFGTSHIWKIGRTADLSARLKAISAHVPEEILEANWNIALQQPWPSEQLAQDMEQAILRVLSGRRTVGERVQISESELIKAWTDAIIEVSGRSSTP